MREQIEKLIIAYEKQFGNLKWHKDINGEYLTAEEISMLNWRINDKFDTIQDLKKLLRYSE